MSGVYFVADLHFGHKNIPKYRTQFSSSEEHDAYVFHNIMEISGKRNTLWILGDSFFTEDSLRYLVKMRPYFQSINKVLGNHCTEAVELQRNIKRMMNENLVDSVHSLVRYKNFWLSHAPIHPDELRGKKNIHGHTHSHKIDDPRYIGVSLEQIDYKPISLESIRILYEAQHDYT